MSKQILTIEQSAEKMRNALKGKKRNEDAIMEVIIDSTHSQRLDIRKFYNITYNTELEEDMRKELSGNFRDLCIGLFNTIIEYDAKEINQAMKTLTGDPKALVEIFGTRPQWMLKLIKEEYYDLYKKDLEKEIEKNTSTDYKKMLLTLLRAERSQNKNPDLNQCQEDARRLYEGGEGMLGTDEEIFHRIYSQRSAHELILIGRCYFHKTGRTLIQAIEAEFTGKTRSLFKTVLYAIINPSELFAKLVRKSIVGLGTNTTMLNRVIITRHEIDMGIIKEFYKYKYNVDIKEDIIGDTSGNYQKLLIALVDKY